MWGGLGWGGEGRGGEGRGGEGRGGEGRGGEGRGGEGERPIASAGDPTYTINIVTSYPFMRAHTHTHTRYIF